MESNLLDATQASEYLNISRSSLYLLLKDKRILSVRIGRCRRIPLEELHRFVNGLVTE